MVQSELDAHDNVVQDAFFKDVEPPHVDQLIDNDGWHKQAEPPCDYKYGMQTDPSRGWWPVCIVNWHTEHSDHGWAADPDGYFLAQRAGRLCAYAICWYQLHDGQWVLVLW